MLRQLVWADVLQQSLLPPTVSKYLDLLEGHLVQERFDERIGQREHLGSCSEGNVHFTSKPEPIIIKNCWHDYDEAMTTDCSLLFIIQLMGCVSLGSGGFRAIAC